MNRYFKGMVLISIVSAIMTSCAENNAYPADDSRLNEVVSVSSEYKVEDIDSVSEGNSEDITQVCVISNDTNIFHNGIEFDDKDLMDKTISFIDTVKNIYEPVAEPEDHFPKGVYTSVSIKKGDEKIHYIYIGDPEKNLVKIDDDYYETAGGETLDYLDQVNMVVSDYQASLKDNEVESVVNN